VIGTVCSWIQNQIPDDAVDSATSAERFAPFVTEVAHHKSDKIQDGYPHIPFTALLREREDSHVVSFSQSKKIQYGDLQPFLHRIKR
jgi:hypothetical protein